MSYNFFYPEVYCLHLLLHWFRRSFVSTIAFGRGQWIFFHTKCNYTLSIYFRCTLFCPWFYFYCAIIRITQNWCDFKNLKDRSAIRGAGGWGVVSRPRPGNPTGQPLPTCLPTHWENSFCILGPQAQIQNPLKCASSPGRLPGNEQTWQRKGRSISSGVTCCHGNKSVTSKGVRVRGSGQIRPATEKLGWKTEGNGQGNLAEMGRKESPGLTAG